MTRTELLKIGDNWYNRAGKLVQLVWDANETPERKERASKLIKILMNRIGKIMYIQSQVHSPKFPKGGR